MSSTFPNECNDEHWSHLNWKILFVIHFITISLHQLGYNIQNNAIVSSSAFRYFSLTKGKGRKTLTKGHINRLDKCCHRWGQTSFPFGIWVQADTSSLAWCLIKSPTSLNIKSYLHTFFLRVVAQCWMETEIQLVALISPFFHGNTIITSWANVSKFILLLCRSRSRLFITQESIFSFQSIDRLKYIRNIQLTNACVWTANSK